MSTYNVELQPLDVLLYRRRWYSPIGLGIALMTGSPWTHAGIVLPARPCWSSVTRWLVCDACEAGIDVRPVSSDLLIGSTIGVMRMPDDHPPIAIAALTDFIWANWGVTPYGVRKILHNGWIEVFGGADKPDPADAPDRVMCSEWASLCLRKFASFDPCPQFADRFTTPADLAKKSLLRWITTDLQLAKG